MRSVVWRAEGGACNRLLRLARAKPAACGWLRPAIAAAVALAVVGCAPHYRDWEDAAYDAHEGAQRPKPKAKAATAAPAKTVKIPVPNQALLTPPADPKCEDVRTAATTQSARTEPKDTSRKDVSEEPGRTALSPGASAGPASAATPPSGANDAEAVLAMRIKLEYERECYRLAELRARGRLKQLQDSVGATIKAVEAQSR